MITKQINESIVELTAAEGCELRRLGNSGTGVKRVLVSVNGASEWQEVSAEEKKDETDKVLAERYRAKVRERYLQETVRRIRLRYSADDEAAILRKAIASTEPDSDAAREFGEYNAYAEQCKREALEWAEDSVLDKEGGDYAEA